jgi:ribA/ribD-fused uncharacterized protein
MSQPPISVFDGAFRFLSNFCSAPIEYEGISYDSVEHAYQAAKTLNKDLRQALFSSDSTASAGQAKKFGRCLKLRDDWEQVRLEIMYQLVKTKFAVTGRRQEFHDKLVATGDRELIEGNTWGDTFWGVCNGRGENHLGKILMRVRDELQRQPLAGDTRMPFGKYRDQLLKDIPIEYLEWLMGTEWVQPELKDRATRAIAERGEE